MTRKSWFINAQNTWYVGQICSTQTDWLGDHLYRSARVGCMVDVDHGGPACRQCGAENAKKNAQLYVEKGRKKPTTDTSCLLLPMYQKKKSWFALQNTEQDRAWQSCCVPNAEFRIERHNTIRVLPCYWSHLIFRIGTKFMGQMLCT